MSFRLLPKLKISSRVLLFFLLVSLVPLLIVSIVLADRGRVLLLDAAKTKQQVIAESTADKVNIYLDDRVRALVLQARLLAVTNISGEVASKNFSVLMNQDKSVLDVVLLNTKGIRVVKVDGGVADYTPLDNTSTDSFKAVNFLSGKHFVSSVSYGVHNEPSITIAVPIISPTNNTNITSDQFLGVIVAKYDLWDLWQSVLAPKIGDGGYAYVVDSLGNLVAHPDSKFLANNQKLSEIGAVKNYINEDYSTTTTTSEKGVNVVSTPKKLSNNNWAVIVQEPVSSIYSGMNSFIRLSVIIIVSSGLFAIGLSLIFRIQLLNPIRQLIIGTNKVSSGDFDYTVKVNSNDELKDLANTFNSMSRSISKLIGDLNIKNADLDMATKQLSHANSQLKIADATKDEFISMASHQLGTPLATIEGYLSLVNKGIYGPIDEKLAKTVHKAMERTQVMKGLLLDFLDVSRMTAKKFKLDIVSTDLNKVIEEEVTALQAAASVAEIQLTYHTPTKTPPLINLDEQKTRQAIMNLLTNAINYTAGGKVDVFLRYNETYMQYTVVDTGIGVPDIDKPKLFSKFYRADNAKEFRPTGTGIGLYLVKRVVEDQGGKIIFHSEHNKGSTFGFIFPLKTNLPLGLYSPPSNDVKEPDAA